MQDVIKIKINTDIITEIWIIMNFIPYNTRIIG